MPVSTAGRVGCYSLPDAASFLFERVAPGFDRRRISPRVAGLMGKASNRAKLLFVCSRNKLRSPTAEKLFEGSPLYHARSAGTQPGARIVVTEGHLGWADMVFCMEKSHAQRLRQKFPEALAGKRVVCLHIPDDYEYMDPELIAELQAKLEPHITLP